MSGKLFIVSACSGAGKTTLVCDVLSRLSNTYSIARVVTYTSRSVRVGEVAGEHYHYVTPQDFRGLVAQGFFLEWSGEYDHYYGTPRHIMDEVQAGASRILIIDRVGAQSVLRVTQDPAFPCQSLVVPIWIEAPSIEELRRRLMARGENTEEQVKRRLEIAHKEIEQESKNSLYKYRILNDNFTKASQELEMLLIQELASY